MSEILQLECPKCHFSGQAEIARPHRYVIYVCPVCKSNVVNYNNKTGVLSDKYIRSLIKHKKLKVCGNVVFPDDAAKEDPASISNEKILDLKILLETEKSIDDLLSKI